MLRLEVEERGPWQEISSSSAHQAAHAEVPMPLCARACVHIHVCARVQRGGVDVAHVMAFLAQSSVLQNYWFGLIHRLRG